MTELGEAFQEAIPFGEEIDYFQFTGTSPSDMSALIDIDLIETLSPVNSEAGKIFGLFSVHLERSFSIAIIFFLDSSIYLYFVECYHVTRFFYSYQS